jgi:protein associated with RNAse G/E
MKADVELVITHDGKRWVARNDAITASAETLPELDANVAEALREQGNFGKVTVFMGFKFSTIPTWIRQYASHYFNRYVLMDL